MSGQRRPTGRPGAREHRPREHRRGGFTMVEVIIAITILTVGVLAMASTTAWVVRQTTFADLMTERAAAFQTVVERIQADTSFSNVLGGGSTTVGIFSATWTATLNSANDATVTIVTTGPGLAPSSSPYPVMSPTAVDTFVFIKLRGAN